MNAAQKAALTAKIANELSTFSARSAVLAGLHSQNTTTVLAKQIVDSIRRVQYVERVGRLPIARSTSDPARQHFDPIRAAVYQRNQGNFDEACWLIFLAIHCGKHLADNWLLAAELYGSIDAQNRRTWHFLSAGHQTFSDWLNANLANISGRFGNHRKYESLKPNSSSYTGIVIDSYFSWVSAHQGHHALFQRALCQSRGSPTKAFGFLYNSMDRVHRFGRTGKFDYLTMLAKLGLVAIEPDKAYLASATGPKRGVRLLLNNDPAQTLSAHAAEALVAALGASLSIPSMTMQVMEDAICNWQKSPERYVCFRG